MSRRGLILDLDNTLYNWGDAFLPSLRAMTHKLSSEFGVSEEDVLADFRNVYRDHGSVEYPAALGELELWKRLGITGEEKARFETLVGKVFSITYRKRLHLFPNVEEVLEWAREEGIVVVGLSDAWERWVCLRLRALGIEKYFDGLYTWHREPWFEGRRRHRSSIRRRFQLSTSELKPNREVVERVLGDFGLEKSTTYMVGDSLAKDIRAAQAAGVVDVWARYGTHLSERNLKTLREITPWSKAKKDAEDQAVEHITPSFTIDDFGQLTHLIGSERLTLFD